MQLKKCLTVITTMLIAFVLWTTPSEAASHVVKKGDTLYSISKKYNVTVNQIKNLNKLKSNTIKIGQTLNTTAPVTTAKTVAKSATKVNKTFKVVATSYTAGCKGCSGITATGLNLKKNPAMKVIAVDPKIIPLGTKVYVEGYGTAVASDTGGAIKGNKIDVFYSSATQAKNWGRRTVTVTIL